MNTRAIVIVSIMIFIILILGGYGYDQQIEAEMAMERSIAQEKRAIEAQALAEEQRMIANKVMEQYQTALRDLELLKQKCK